MAESTEAVTNNFNILLDSVRRYVLDYFDEQETPVSFDRLATRVAPLNQSDMTGPPDDS